MPRRPSSIPLAVIGVLVPVSLLVGIFIGGHPGALPRPLRAVFLGERERTLQDAYDIIHRDYYRAISRDALVDRSLAGAVRSLGDRFSAYYDPRAYRRFEEDSNGQFSGVGMEVSEVPRGLRVTRVFPGAPAERAGIRAGDRIVAADGRSLAGRPAAISTALIRGRPGTYVRLTVVSRGRRRVEHVARARVNAPSVTSRLRTVGGRRVGVVELAGFTAGAHGEVRDAIDRLRRRGARAIVLDLRGNGGGLLQEAVLVSSIFIPDGTIVSTDGRSRRRHVFQATGDAIPRRIPVAVLVDRGSASASEIVTGAIQDRRRGKVVGTRTFGKGVFQEVEELPNGGALDITVGEYFTPSGRNLGGGGVRRGAGIRPDVRARDNPRTAPDEALNVALRTVRSAI
jgi:carboxyl-terminal processing protease